jgi:hypothetical protein
MDDMIWIGNHLVPRGLAILAVFSIAAIVIMFFVVLTDDRGQ